MTITRWEPFWGLDWQPIGWTNYPEMERLQRRMLRLFEPWLPTRLGTALRIPPLEIEETEDEILLKLEIPGMEAKDLDIEVTEESVTIRGERKSAEKEGLHSEFRYGKWERTIPLPVHIQTEGVKAEYKNGILHLTLPKVEAEKHKTVKVELG